MTVAVAFKTGQGVWIASDTQLTYGPAKYVCASKWTKLERCAFVIGGPALVTERMDLGMGAGPMEVMDRIRSVVRQEVEPKREPQEPLMYGIEALITDGFTIWRMISCLSRFEVQGGFAAIGSGEAEAMGAMYGITAIGPAPLGDLAGDAIAAVAVEAACHADRGCSGLWGPVLIPR
jgi:ATP-dependent protease HslVU (ClpYQ) peptidase subunit